MKSPQLMTLLYETERELSMLKDETVDREKVLQLLRSAIALGTGCAHLYNVIVTETWTTPTYKDWPFREHSKQLVVCVKCGDCVDPVEAVKPRSVQYGPVQP